MRKLLLAALLFITLLVPVTVSAQYNLLPPECQDQSNPAYNASACKATGSNPISGRDGVLSRVVSIFSYAVGAASIIMIIFGGMKYISANGDSTKVASARDTILYALIGVVVFLSSQLIVRFVLSSL